MRKALCVFGVSWVCNALRQPTTLSPNANKLSTHFSLKQIAETNCLLATPQHFVHQFEERRRRMLCFVQKNIFCLWESEVLLEILLINLKWEEEVRCLWLSLSLLFKLIWDLQQLRQQLTHRMNGNLKVLTSITSLNKLRRCSNKRQSCCLQIN